MAGATSHGSAPGTIGQAMSLLIYTMEVLGLASVRKSSCEGEGQQFEVEGPGNW